MHLGAEDQVWFSDAVHPMHNSEPAYGWIKKGKIKELKANTGRQRINLNGAYNPDTQEVVIREDESIDSDSTIKLLKTLMKKCRLGILYIILDNARYNKSRKVQEFQAEHEGRLKIIYLPTYSPNLNLIERL